MAQTQDIPPKPATQRPFVISRLLDEGHESMKGGWTRTLDRLVDYLAEA